MSDTVYGQLAGTSTGLARKLEQNQALCGVLSALLGRVVIECSNRGVSISNVHMWPMATQGEGVFTSAIDYGYRGFQVPAGFGEKGTFEEYLAHKGVQLAKVLAVNHSVSRFFESLVSRLEMYALDKGIDFSELWVMEDGAFISKDDVLVLKVVSQKKRWSLLEKFTRYGR